jgi:hypothetical protein
MNAPRLYLCLQKLLVRFRAVLQEEESQRNISERVHPDTLLCVAHAGNQEPWTDWSELRNVERSRLPLECDA